MIVLGCDIKKRPKETNPRDLTVQLGERKKKPVSKGGLGKSIPGSGGEERGRSERTEINGSETSNDYVSKRLGKEAGPYRTGDGPLGGIA